MTERENLSSRLGFILISAGCAIGIGNVWRFPFVTGMYGGGAFVLMYLLFLVILGLPIMVMEFSVGRASKRSAARSFHILEPKGTKWHIFSFIAILGNYCLMMFYTTVCGWMFAYFYKTLKGDFVGLNSDGVNTSFSAMLSNPYEMTFWMIVAILFGFGICALGLKRGVERITKIMMLLLLSIMIILCIKSLTLPGGGKGIAFYLMPDFNRLVKKGIFNGVYAALGQAFFTLSIGIGALAIFGSYINKDRRLTGEAVHITILDTFMAFMSGLIIFPACYAFSVNPAAGPGLIFITLPNIFNKMSGGRFWGALFFLFMTFAALSTVIAVFENILTFSMELFNWSRKKSVLINGVALTILSMPCVLGFNKWSTFKPFGAGSNILDLEDFIVTNNILPIGSLIYLAFCVSKYGWGWKNFISEADSGKGLKFPKSLKWYFKYILPLIVLFIFIMGYKDKFF